jgi:superfamily I DNA and RNA helicase
VCNRNTPWSLTTAHAIGFGIYRLGGPVQSFDNPELWQEIGYHVVDGELNPGQNVVLERSENSYPRYFAELLNPDDCVSWRAFENQNDEVAWVSEQIQKNLTDDELTHTDIMVVIPNAITAKVVAAHLIEALDRYQISAHLAGVTTSVDRLYQEGSIAIGSIFRAKGNEGSMVYVLDSDYAIQPFGSVRGRNSVFTAITRSRAWVRICGCGPNMANLISELQAVKENAYRLRFSVPTAKQLDNMRRIHRDLTEADIARHKTMLKGVEQFLSAIESGELPPEALPAEIRRRLAAVKAEDDAE